MLASAALAALLSAGCGSSVSRAPKRPDSVAARESSAYTPVSQASSLVRRAPTVGQFGEQGDGGGQFQEPFGVGVDWRSGYVYVLDTNHSRIEKFTAAGHFLLAWGWGVADGKTHALQTCVRRCHAGIRGSGAGQLHLAEGVAVDNDMASSSRGDLYVVDIGNHRVEKFDPQGRFLLMFGGGVNRTAREHHSVADEDVCPVRSGDLCGEGVEGGGSGGGLELAVEGTFIVVHGGAVYVGQRNAVKIFAADGRYRSQIALRPAISPTPGEPEGGGVSALAVSPAGDLYVVRHGSVGIEEYTPSGRLIRTLEPGGGANYSEGPTPSLAMTPAGNLFVDVYANLQHRFDELSSSGEKLVSFDLGPKGLQGPIVDREDGLPGIAYDPRSNRLYVVNADVNVKPIVERVRILAPPRAKSTAGG